MSENQLRVYLQNIWSNWRLRENECENCPHWGTGGGTKPFYGIGELSGDFPTVAFVARDPGPGGEPDISELDKKEELELTDKEVDQLESHIKEEYSRLFSENRASNIMQTGMCNGEYTESGRPHSPQMKNCAESFIQNRYFDFNIYYTNLKKCREFDRDETGTKEAISHCQGYIEMELSELEPDIIVTFGNEATSAVYNLFLTDELQNRLGIHPDLLTERPSEAKNVSYEALKLRKVDDNTAIIPSIHFSNFGRNLDRWVKPRRDDISDDLTPGEYWDQLVNMSVEALQK